MRTELSSSGRTVRIDHTRCSGTGYCHEALPDLFELSDKRAWLREGYDLASADVNDLEEAAAACPWFAINVEGTA